MNVKRITAIIPPELLPSLEKQLRRHGVDGITVEHVRGYGEHPNYFRRDMMHENVRLIIYADEDNVEDYVDAIRTCANESDALHGVLTVETIDRMERLVVAKTVIAEED